MRTIPRLLAAVAFAATALCVSPALADDGFTIAHVEPAGKDLQILVSVPEGSAASLDSFTVTIDGHAARTKAEPAGESVEAIRRTTIMAVDTSLSMRNHGRFQAAKAAAGAFLESVPGDVYVGVVTFDSDVETALSPTLDRDAALEVINNLQLARETRLNDGVIAAAELAGREGQRHVLVLSDGRDTSQTAEAEVTAAIEASGVSVDVVALDQAGAELDPLKTLASAGNGSVISADPGSLTAAFDDEAASLSRQVLLTATIPTDVSATESTVGVASGNLGDKAHVVIRDAAAVAAGIDRPATDDAAGFEVTRPMMLAGVGALGVGLMGLLGSLMWSAGAPKPGPTIEQRIAPYTGTSTVAMARPGDGMQLNLDQARTAAARVLHHNRDLEERISIRLVAAGSVLKPAEWLLIHAGIAVGAGLVGALLSGGNVVTSVVLLLLGALIPWLWLGRRRKKRLAAFNAGLSDTLQLISGSLSAGMSFAQSLDTVVREGREPIAGEFRQALVQSRLGLPLVDALDQIAVRTESKDFAWVVMAVRIQRQVGGNLNELLGTVANTMREREYLRRQVQTLSAEGRLSGWILGLLPVGIGLYLLLLRRDYIRPLYTEPLGLMMLAGAAVLLSLGAFLMSRIAKVEV